MKWIRQTLAGLSVLALSITTTALFAEPTNSDSRDTDAPAKRVDTPPKAPSARAMPSRAPLYYDNDPEGNYINDRLSDRSRRLSEREINDIDPHFGQWQRDNYWEDSNFIGYPTYDSPYQGYPGAGPLNYAYPAYGSRSRGYMTDPNYFTDRWWDW